MQDGWEGTTLSPIKPAEICHNACYAGSLAQHCVAQKSLILTVIYVAICKSDGLRVSDLLQVCRDARQSMSVPQ
jgi:hypothetical protein